MRVLAVGDSYMPRASSRKASRGLSAIMRLSTSPLAMIGRETTSHNMKRGRLDMESAVRYFEIWLKVGVQDLPAAAHPQLRTSPPRVFGSCALGAGRQNDHSRNDNRGHYSA
jgi:hypothetical protein